MFPNLKQLYQQLIACSSISSTDPNWDQSNEPVIDLLADWLDTLGCHVTKRAIQGHYGKYNLVAHLGSGEGGLMLSGHSDTVPYDQSLWNFDPFALTESNNRWYGLGSIDMKGFFAFVIDAIAQLDHQYLKRPLYVVATADEETSMVGAQYLVEEATKRGALTLSPDAIIIGEPTDLKPIFAHKGHRSYGLRIQGRSGHSSQPATGINALEVLNWVLTEILKLKETLKAKYPSPLFQVPYPTLNLGSIHGGDSPNRICGQCLLGFDIRPTPELSPSELARLLDPIITTANQLWPATIELHQQHVPIPAFHTEPNSSLVKTLQNLGGQSPGSVNYCTEAPFLQQLGYETLVFGPGSILQAHRPDEYLTLHSIDPTRKALSQLIQTYCF